MEDAERVRAVCSAIPTDLDCTSDLVAVSFDCSLSRHHLSVVVEHKWLSVRVGIRVG